MRSVSICPETGLRKGTWTQEEDRLLSAYIKRYGLWNWREIPKYAGLSRCGKSCRLRWMNYLRPDIKRGNFTTEEDEIITNLIQKFGQRWSLIAAKLPGRTDNEVKNHWHTSLKKQNPSAALKEVKRVKSAKSRRALNNSCDPLSLSSLILESSAVVPLLQQCSSDSSVSVSDSEAAIVEHQAIQECEMLLDTNVNFLGESSTEPILLEYVEQMSGASTVATSDLSEEFPTEPILLEEAHLWDNNSSNWIDSLLSDPFPLIEEALCAYNLCSTDYSMDFLFSQ